MKRARRGPNDVPVHCHSVMDSGAVMTTRSVWPQLARHDQRGIVPFHTSKAMGDRASSMVFALQRFFFELDRDGNNKGRTYS